ncbi:anti-sigma factor [Asticcacaulis sp. AND118]|uniref:anti-sigma factor family protein n=1 Tax=Asticcacaulis sp. AND118 TaxID=2840468 RepID=UPI001CFFEAAC|nr:hypothetical protein [Asticcacaulis sp. AND118]UDF05015.1 hypothetical protein LH365_16610 [Asticcacaulis sp. AND118]
MSALTDDETLIAYVDGELDEAARAAFEVRAAADPALAARIDAHWGLKARLGAAFGPIVDEAVPENLRALLPPAPTAEARDNVRAFTPRPAPKTAPAKSLHLQIAALAACFVAGIGLTLFFPAREGDFRTEDGAIVAQGELARSLSHQLASDTGKTTIGLTFADQSGAICRTFTTGGNEGLACRQNGNWRIEALTGKGAQGEFRQAGSSLILQAVDARLSGDVFDAEAERKARDSGWTR